MELLPLPRTVAAESALQAPAAVSTPGAAAPVTESVVDLYPAVRRRASNVGLLLLRSETQKHPCIPLFYFTLDGDLELERLRDSILRGLGGFERFRARLSDGHFVDDGSFAIEDHVSELTPASFGGEPTPDTLRHFLEDRFARPLDPSRPMWEMLMVRGYREELSGPAKTIVISRVHHVIVDGTAAMRMLGSITDEFASGALTGETARRKADEAVARVTKRNTTPCGPLGLGIGALTVLCKYAVECCRLEPSTPFRGATGAKRSIAWTSLQAQPSLDAARARKCTLNDLWMSIITAAMDRYMLECRRLPTQSTEVTFGLPVSLHAPILPPEIGNTAGNKFGFLTVRLPLGAVSRDARLNEVRTRMNRAKRSPEALVSYALAACTGCLPDSVIQCGLTAAGSSRASTIMSNVRGPTETLHVQGLAMGKLFGFLPTPPSVGLGIGLGTYAGQLNISVACDKELMGDDAGLVLQMIIEESEAIIKKPS
jgi:diacylglycerol O-acyltransferase